LRALLHSLPNIEVIGEASDGHEAVDVIARHQPDVVIMDIGMPGLNGVDSTRRIVKQSPGTRVIILSMQRMRNMLAGRLTRARWAIC
jgi:NarL family two-component system response regulator LiaR